ncbi:MAG: type II toxin-antitoxin system RelE/ParE family toxin [Verrucomicrobiota bacterium]|nr:type II toxin-antitoxin system RelE/ParE family toxin [Verrucomicrobiota bacterium]
MGYQVALSPSARRDLRDIVRYISLDSSDRAVTFGQFLVSHTKRLAEFPELGRVVPEFDISNLREIVVRSYRVIYRVDHLVRRVDIIRFWHGARGTPEMEVI